MPQPKSFLTSMYGRSLVLCIALLTGACSSPEKNASSEAQQSEETATQQTTELQTTTGEAVEYTPTALAKLPSYTTTCGDQSIDLAGPVAEIAAALEDSSFLYAVKPLTDCSGIFHRVLRQMKERCPEQAYPPIETYRDTRSLARWYHEQGRFILIKDALASADLIKPGAVLFYGQQGKKYTDFTAEDLFQRGTGINHMGVVVKVHKDASGQVTSYELFHGHGRPGKTPASTTNYHRRIPTRDTYPPFGNGTEQWIAFATLVSPAGEKMTAK